MLNRFLNLHHRSVNLNLAVVLAVYLVPRVSSSYPDILNVSAEQIFKLLNETRILGDVIQTAPKHTCKVLYFEDTAAELGNVLLAKEVSYAPRWCQWTGDNSSYYTFLVTGPDEPSREHPTEREHIHWLVGNINGDNILRSKEYVYDYIGPYPKKGIGNRRLVYLVYKQSNGELTFDERRLNDSTSTEGNPHRRNFSCRKFAKKYDLGDPVAVNFVYVE
ncbi:protein D3 [Bemisia tabaci]|uniref:protein D3 n=1 Tax=Bemisia tabaci TaxID=7038 RepID=UPI0008F9D947|nr:PREDICTED: protein D3-like [Bemisia tabaci]